MTKKKVLVSWVSPNTDCRKNGETRLLENGPSYMLQEKRLKNPEYRYKKHFWLASWSKNEEPDNLPGINEVLKNREEVYNRIHKRGAPDDSEIVLKHIPIDNPTNINEILNRLEDFVLSEPDDFEIDVSLAGGTPQMSAAWYIFAFYRGIDRKINLYNQPNPSFTGGRFEFNLMEKQVESRLKTLARKQKENSDGRSAYFVPLDKNDPTYIVEMSKGLTKEAETAWQIAQLKDVTAIIQGETGVGKTLFAKKIHNDSSRKLKAFKEIHCAGVADDELYSILFGCVAGYNGTPKERKGIFDLADGGTVFLDEIGDTSLKFQAAFLKVLDRDPVSKKMKIQPLGSTKEVEVDVRVIAATSKDLKKLCKNGEFRSDLYYRLGTSVLYIPSLRSRKRDIKAYVKHFLNQKADEYERNKLLLDEDAHEALVNYPYPGNLRELINIITNLYIRFDNPRRMLGLSDLDDNIITPEYTFPFQEEPETWDYEENVRLFKEQFVNLAVKVFGNAEEAAKAIGKSIGTIENHKNYSKKKSQKRIS